MSQRTRFPRRTTFAVTLLAALAASLTSASRAAAVDVSPPVTIRLTVLADPRPESFVGDMTAYDETGLTLDVRGGERQRFAWVDLTAQSAFIARYRAVDESDARQWLALAAFGRAVGAERQAEAALDRALGIDPSLAAEADRVRALPADTLRRPPATRPAEEPPADDPPADDPPADDPLDAAASNATPPPMPAAGGRAAPGTDPHKFLAVTDGEALAALRDARRDADRDLRSLGVRMRQLETPHFLIFTNWEAADDGFLADSLEDAYRLVGREFDIPFDQNVFVGKLPVYMFDAHDDFLRYARDVDGQKGFRDSVAGYYRGRSDGMGKMAMSKPRSTRDVGLTVARQLWARTLTHEFTHAFFARYRSNAFVPRWLNEGLAEVIAERVYPRPGASETVRTIARSGRSIADLFDDSKMPPGDFYPVAMTLVQCLYRESPAKFGRYVDRIKAGEDPQSAMLNLYGVDYRGLETAWRQWAARQ